MTFLNNLRNGFRLKRLPGCIAGPGRWGILVIGTFFLLAGCAGSDPYETGNPSGSTFSEDLNALHFIDGREGWAVGDQGSLVHTTNGGATWQRRDIGTTRDLLDITFVDSNNGWIVGEGGLILRTASAGLGWVRQENQSTGNLNSVQFLNLNTGWAVGENGTILFTTNGGLMWSLQPGGESHRLNDVFFRDANTGWIVGDRGVILFTEDGTRGGFWTLQVSGTTRTLNAVQWNGDHAVAVGAEGVIIKTGFGSLGGGGRWVTVPPTMSTASISDVFFIDSSRGWIVDRSGVVLYTRDDGVSWVDRSPHDAKPLNAIFFNSPEVGWAVGDDGVIMYTVDGGTFWIEQRVY